MTTRMIAHVAGVPVEELLLPLLAGGATAVAVAAGSLTRRARRTLSPRSRRGRGGGAPPTAEPDPAP